jgi:hypothetical protein
MKHMEANKHKHGHHHHKNEMEHHKMRDKHKAAHESKMSEHGHSSGDIPNPKMANDNHQQGIERIKQRHGDMPVGQHGSMAGGWSHERHGK